MSWSKVTIYYKHNLSSLVASSTASGFDVANLLDRLERTLWKGDTIADITIKHDAGAGNTYYANSLRIARHNLASIGATLSMQYSTDDFVSDINNAFTPFIPSDDKAIIKEFTAFNIRYSRIKLTRMTDKPSMALAEWGRKTELDFASQLFDPHSYADNDNFNISAEGHLLGIHETWKERDITLVFDHADDTLYQKLVDLYGVVDLQNFFCAWEKTDHAADKWLVRRQPGRRNNPLIYGGNRRTITLNLTGRME